MKTTAILFVLLALAELAPAAPPEHWVSRDAQAVIDRMTAAYAAIDGWTATTVEYRTSVNGVKELPVVRTTERYVRGGGLADCYASTRYHNTEAGEFTLLTWQNADSCYGLTRERTGALAGKTSPPNVSNLPWVLNTLKAIATTRYVRHGGWDSVAGQNCDILELISVNENPAAPGKPAVPPSVYTSRCYVDPSGFIVRHTTMVAGWNSNGLFSDRRFTYDTRAGLTAADFSRENFERAAAEILRGDPMPEMVEQLHRSGGTLPAVSFTAWADRKPFRVSDLQGKVVVLETWTSWCYFCKEAFPYYEKMRQALAAQDVVFVAVSFDENLANYEKWMNEHGADYGFKFGRIDAEDPKEALKDFKGALPAFYVLGRDGKIISSYTGYGYGKGGEDPRLLAALRKAGVKI